MDREEERDGSEEEVVGGVGILSLGLDWSKAVAVQEDGGEPCRERSGLRVGDGGGQGEEAFGVSCGSMAEEVQKECKYWQILNTLDSW